MDPMYIYLDYNSTTPFASSVVDVMERSMICSWANPSSRSMLGNVARFTVEDARAHVAQMIDAEPNEITFTSGGTEGSNMIIKSVVENCYEQYGCKPHVITTTVEHDCVAKHLESLHCNGFIDLTKVPLEPNGTLSVDKVVSAVLESTRLIVVMLANNETGIIFPISELSEKIGLLNNKRENFSILFFTDGAQGVGKIPVSVKDLGVDYMTIVGHKFYGPRIGAVFCKTGAPIAPLLYGGGQEKGIRSGTENTLCIAGLGEAAKLVIKDLDCYIKDMSKSKEYLVKKIQSDLLDYGAVINFEGDYPKLPNTVSVSFLGHDGRKIIEKCKKVIASAGSACHSDKTTPSKILLQLLPYENALGAIRLSTGRETTTSDIDAAIEDLKQAINS